MQTFGNTGSARLRARLELLKKLDESVNASRLRVCRVHLTISPGSQINENSLQVFLRAAFRHRFDKLPDPLDETVKTKKVSNKLAPTRDTRFDKLFDFAAAPLSQAQ